MPSKGISTAGMGLYYAVASSRPSAMSAWTKIPEVKSLPSFNPSPSTIDITPLDETDYVLYTPGLKDMGGTLEYSANLTDELIQVWTSAVTAYGSMTSGQSMYWMLYHPKLAQATYFTGEPSPLGANEATVNAALETTLYITPNSAPGLAAKPTASGGSVSSSASISGVTGVTVTSFNSTDTTLDEKTLTLSAQLDSSTKKLTIGLGSGISSSHTLSIITGSATMSSSSIVATGNSVVVIGITKTSGSLTSVLGLDMSFFSPSSEAVSGTITFAVSA